MRVSKTERERTMEDADREKGAKEASKRGPPAPSLFLSLSLSLSLSRSSRKERDVPGTLAIAALLSLGFTVQLTFCRLLLRAVRRFIRLAYIQTRYTSFRSSCIFPLFLHVPLLCYFPRNFLHLSTSYYRANHNFQNIHVETSIRTTVTKTIEIFLKVTKY